MESRVEQTMLERSGQKLRYEPAEKTGVLIVQSFPELGTLTALRFIEWVQQNPGGVVSLPTGKTPEYFIKEVLRFLKNWDNSKTMKELEEAHAQILRQKTYEALATSTTQAIHWIGNKALPITTTIERLKLDLEEKIIDIESFTEDLELINTSAKTIIQVKENLLGPAREEAPRIVMIEDVAYASASYLKVPKERFILEASQIQFHLSWGFGNIRFWEWSV